MGANSLLEPVFVAMTAALKPLGFAKSGSTFRLRNADTIAIISLQSSTSSTLALAKVTVNLGVHVPALQDTQRPEDNPSAWSAHWHQRIGHLLPDNSDVWWSIRTVDEGRVVAAEVVRCVEQVGLPAIAQVSTVADLQQLWKSGCSPGLTSGQRARYLQQLVKVQAS
jgi:hypothetical protein